MSAAAGLALKGAFGSLEGSSRLQASSIGFGGASMPFVSIPKLKSQTQKLNSSSSSSSSSSSGSNSNSYIYNNRSSSSIHNSSHEVSNNISSNSKNDSIIQELISIVNKSLVPINAVDGNRALTLLRSMLFEDSIRKDGQSFQMEDESADPTPTSTIAMAVNNQSKENLSKSQVHFGFIDGNIAAQSTIKTKANSSNSMMASSTPLKRIDNIYNGCSTLTETNATQAQMTPHQVQGLQASLEQLTKQCNTLVGVTPRRNVQQTPATNNQQHLSIDRSRLKLTAERSPRYKTPGYAKTPGVEVDLWDDDFGGGVIYWDEYDQQSAMGVHEEGHGEGDISGGGEKLDNAMDSSPIIRSNFNSSSQSNIDALTRSAQKLDIAIADERREDAFAKEVLPKRRLQAKSKGINFLEYESSSTPMKTDVISHTSLMVSKDSSDLPAAKSTFFEDSFMMMSSATMPSSSVPAVVATSKRVVKPPKVGDEVTSNSKKKLICKSSNFHNDGGDEIMTIPFEIDSTSSGSFKPNIGIFSDSLTSYNSSIDLIHSLSGEKLSIAVPSNDFEANLDSHIDNTKPFRAATAASGTSEASMEDSSLVDMYEGNSKKPGRRRVSVGGKKKTEKAASNVVMDKMDDLEPPLFVKAVADRSKTDFGFLSNDCMGAVLSSGSLSISATTLDQTAAAADISPYDDMGFNNSDLYENKSNRMSARRRSISSKGGVGGIDFFRRKGSNIALDDVNCEDSELAFTGMMKEEVAVKPPLAVAATSKRTFLKKTAAPVAVAAPPPFNLSIKSYFTAAAPAAVNPSMISMPSTTTTNPIAIAPTSKTDKTFAIGDFFTNPSNSLVVKRSEKSIAIDAVESMKLTNCLSLPAVSDTFDDLVSSMSLRLTKFTALARDRAVLNRHLRHSFKYLPSLSTERMTSRTTLDSSNIIILALISCIKEVSGSIKSSSLSYFKTSASAESEEELMTLLSPLFVLLSANYRDYDTTLIPDASQELTNATFIENRSVRARVRFAEVDGHCVCTPIDRQPDTWKIAYSDALRWHDVLCTATLISHEMTSKNIPIAAVLGKLSRYLSDESENFKRLFESCLAANDLSSNINNSANSISSSSSIVSSSASASENPMKLPIVSIQWRISWHCTSFLRSQLRWLLDPPPHFISAASITGQQGIYETYRSHFYETIQCTAIKKNVYTDFIVDNSNPWQDEKDFQSSDSYKPTETAELTLSYLISEALRQIHIFLKCNTMISFDNMRDLSTENIDSSCATLLGPSSYITREEDRVYIAQLIIAAELSRKFLNNLFSLASFKQLSEEFENKFAMVQDCCMMIYSIGCEDDLHWSLLRSGVDGMRKVTSRAFISQPTIKRCKAIIKDYKTKTFDKHTSELGFGIDEFIFDFPRLESS